MIALAATSEPTPLAAWCPYVGIALIAGLVHWINAWKVLAFDCRYLPYFKPLRQPGVYLWSLFQIALPSIILWFGRGLSNKPPIDGNLVGASFLYGAGFVALLNAKTRIGNRELNLRFFYDSCVALAYNIIARAETARTAQFRLEFIRQLTQKATLFEGLKFLESYFLSDISMPPEQKSNSLKALKEIAKTQDAEERAKKAYAVLLVRRKDLPHALAEFGCSDELIAAVAKN